jgi:hypothetical protein
MCEEAEGVVAIATRAGGGKEMVRAAEMVAIGKLTPLHDSTSDLRSLVAAIRTAGRGWHTSDLARV